MPKAGKTSGKTGSLKLKREPRPGNRTGEFLLLQGHDLVDSSLVTLVAGEFGGQPGVGDFQSQILAHNTGADGHHVGVVVQTGHLGGPDIAQQSAADAVHLVGGDGNADAGGAQHDALLAFAGGDGDFLVFGCETRGLPENLLEKVYDRCVRIPMRAEARSLNLSNSVAVVLYEALRQADFPGLTSEGTLTGREESAAPWLDYV